MSHDLRLYFLAFMLMLWFAPARADQYYGLDSGCPTLAIPVELSGDDVWASYDDPNGYGQSTDDYRALHPSGTHVFVQHQPRDFADCEIEAYAGTYYDGANHMWVLPDSLTCVFAESGNGGDFRAGEEY